jgi:hypothetical protein
MPTDLEHTMNNLSDLLHRAAAATLLACCGFAHAAPTLQTDGAGRLTGALGVDVGGVLYDVSFAVGTCQAVFSGCDEQADFAFSTKEAADAAGAALLSSVFVGMFDDDPTLTAGCSTLDPFGQFCLIHTPYSVSAGVVLASVATNFAAGSPNADQLGTSGFITTFDFSRVDNTLLAVWQPSAVPEPGTLALTVAAVLGLLGAGRRPRLATALTAPALRQRRRARAARCPAGHR